MLSLDEIKTACFNGRLSPQNEEILVFQSELSEFLENTDILKECENTGIKEVSPVPLTSLRTDTEIDFENKSLLTSYTEKTDDNFISVPCVIKESR